MMRRTQDDTAVPDLLKRRAGHRSPCMSLQADGLHVQSRPCPFQFIAGAITEAEYGTPRNY